MHGQYTTEPSKDQRLLQSTTVHQLAGCNRDWVDRRRGNTELGWCSDLLNDFCMHISNFVVQFVVNLASSLLHSPLRYSYQNRLRRYRTHTSSVLRQCRFVA